MATIQIRCNGQGVAVPIENYEGTSRKKIIAVMESKVSQMMERPIRLLGLRKGSEVWPIQLVEATPSTFSEDHFEPVVGERDDTITLEQMVNASNNSINNKSNIQQEQGNDNNVAEFHLPTESGEDIIIQYTYHNFINVENLVTRTGIFGLDAHDVYDTILIATEKDGTMTLRQYTNYVDTLLSNTGNTETIDERDLQEINILKRLLHQLFYAFDGNGAGLVSSDDLTAMFVILCRGSFHHKLRFLFEVFSTRGVDGLTRRQFWKYVRSILTGLVHLAGFNSSAKREAVKFAAAELSARVFGSYNVGDRIQFEQWEEIFTNGGNDNDDNNDDGQIYFEWIHFLDGSTWYTEDREGSPSIGTSPETGAAAVSMRIDLPSLEHHCSIEITQGDVELLRLVSTDTNLGKHLLFFLLLY